MKAEVWSNIIQANKLQDVKAGHREFNKKLLVRLPEYTVLDSSTMGHFCAKNAPVITYKSIKIPLECVCQMWRLCIPCTRATWIFHGCPITQQKQIVYQACHICLLHQQ